MRAPVQNILIIQTAFIGDVILATSFIEQTKKKYPNSSIHFLLRKGNEDLLKNNPHVDQVWVWDKKNGKYKDLIRIIKNLRIFYFEYVFNIQRFFTTGLITLCLRAKNKIGFDKNPLSFFFTKKIKHLIPHKSENGESLHEVQRNYQLLLQNEMPDALDLRPQVYLVESDESKVKEYAATPYLVFAPTSVWFTKQWSIENWKKLCARLAPEYKIYLIGAKSDFEICESIAKDTLNVTNLCGELSLLESAALMKSSKRVFVNDSAPLHLASAVNAPTSAIFCSTIPAFGYFPLSFDSHVFEVDNLSCRPCGLHGKKACPLKHFDCSEKINIDNLSNSVH